DSEPAESEEESDSEAGNGGTTFK
ncbi:MAG: hypothetical protein QOE90_83, partial [Thermoplasmata archaeon]|nr:hypothetical protein [Thermoplasmata archaeon]